MRDYSVDPEVLGKLRALLKEGARWVAYENQDLGHRDIGHIKFLQVGEGCTYVEHPAQLPDSGGDLGWRYRPCGVVDLEAGEIRSFDGRKLG